MITLASQHRHAMQPAAGMCHMPNVTGIGLIVPTTPARFKSIRKAIYVKLRTLSAKEAGR
jgi:hypothetical protein